jgi:hypothetical protein
MVLLQAIQMVEITSAGFAAWANCSIGAEIISPGDSADTMGEMLNEKMIPDPTEEVYSIQCQRNRGRWQSSGIWAVLGMSAP